VLMLGAVGVSDPDHSRVRSLPIEHVSFGPDAQKIIDQKTVAAARKWFFGRSPDAGFLLTGFPATLLQAKFFDEWLETRHESLDAVLVGSGAPEPVVAHYRTLGLIE
jgi:hypothetical protein